VLLYFIALLIFCLVLGLVGALFDLDLGSQVLGLLDSICGVAIVVVVVVVKVTILNTHT